jgi:hypothetical protein
MQVNRQSLFRSAERGTCRGYSQTGVLQSARAMVDALQHTFQDPSKMIPVYALISRIRLSSSSKVVESAERVVSRILTAYSKPNLTPEQIQSGAGTRDDPLRQFSDICRRELESLASGL